MSDAGHTLSHATFIGIRLKILDCDLCVTMQCRLVVFYISFYSAYEGDTQVSVKCYKNVAIIGPWFDSKDQPFSGEVSFTWVFSLWHFVRSGEWMGRRELLRNVVFSVGSSSIISVASQQRRQKFVLWSIDFWGLQPVLILRYFLEKRVVMETNSSLPS